MDLSLPNHPNRDKLEAAANLLIRYANIIGTEDGNQGIFIRTVRIPTNGQWRAPKQHPVPQAVDVDMDAEMKHMATERIIESCIDSKSFNSPVFAVCKKKWIDPRIANFKRIINKLLVDFEPYPTPRIDHLFNKIGEGNKYFASLDLRSGYWQIVIDERDRYKTAFTWRDRYYQYTCLAFGLTSAGLMFFHCIAETLATVASRDKISFYIEDNLVYAKTFKEYMSALEQLFTVLRKFGLKLNPNKCTFLAPKAKFLGVMVNSKLEYVRVIREMEPPTPNELQSLIGHLVWVRQSLETRLYEKIRSDTFSNLMGP